jgi:hypothetical protein
MPKTLKDMDMTSVHIFVRTIQDFSLACRIESLADGFPVHNVPHSAEVFGLAVLVLKTARLGKEVLERKQIGEAQCEIAFSHVNSVCTY